jgi:RHH-type transcriptional regulator, rel operon repressor / antitoxin RelB
MSAISIELPEEVSERLDQLSERTGRSRSDYLLDAITEHLGEMEDLYIAEQRMIEHRAGLSKSYTLDEVEQRLGLVD